MKQLGRFNTVLLTLGLLVGHSPARADEPAVSNLELMSNLTSEVVKELMKGFPNGPDAGHLTLVPHARDERYEFIGDMFTRALTAGNYRVHKAASSRESDSTGARATSAGGYRLEFQAMDFSLRYTKVYRPYLVGGRKVGRWGSVQIMAKVLDGADGSVVWVGEAARSHEDSFGHGELDAVEAGLYEFNKPARLQSNWGRFAEPVLVGGIIVGLVYLFFANQSDEES